VFCLAAARYEAFLLPENLVNVLRQNSMLGLVALGMTFVILTGGIDLSAGALVAVAGIAAAFLSRYGAGVATLGSILVTCAIGAGNGVLITRGRIPPFIATLCMTIAARGVALAVTAEEAVRIDRAATGLRWLGRGYLGPFPVPVTAFVLAFTVSWVLLTHTAFGRRVYAIGDNAEAARAMGSNEGSVLIPVYAISGALAGMAGLILASRLGMGHPVAGTGWELDAIAAVVVGGTLLTGGAGGVGSTVIGVLLLGLLFNVFNLEGTISSWWQWVLRGLFLLAVAVLQRVGASREAQLQP
jgi:ribose/xylose/arabinose/galactoside ABC-type transport system permease subunit